MSYKYTMLKKYIMHKFLLQVMLIYITSGFYRKTFSAASRTQLSQEIHPRPRSEPSPHNHRYRFRPPRATPPPCRSFSPANPAAFESQPHLAPATVNRRRHRNLATSVLPAGRFVDFGRPLVESGHPGLITGAPEVLHC